jgi:hypothetical protein
VRRTFAVCFFLTAGFLTACSETGIEHGMENSRRSFPAAKRVLLRMDDPRVSPVPGTVARGHLEDDTLLYTGKQGGKDATVFPVPITRAIVERGRQR